MKRYDYGHLHLILITSALLTKRLLEHKVAKSKYVMLFCHNNEVLLKTGGAEHLKTEFWHQTQFLSKKIKKDPKQFA